MSIQTVQLTVDFNNLSDRQKFEFYQAISAATLIALGYHEGAMETALSLDASYEELEDKSLVGMLRSIQRDSKEYREKHPECFSPETKH